MRVSDVMQRHVDSVDTNATVLDVARLIFGRKVNGVPVCKGKKVIGFVTERDILSKFFPSVQEYMEDAVHARDFEGMEEKIEEIFSLPVSKIMSKNPATITSDTPLLKAQSMMMVKKIGRLPVIDGKDNLIGIISKGDIFKAVVGKKMPYAESEEYHDWIAKHYDFVVGWESRLDKEIPALVELFKKNKIEKILDVGCGTGEHAIALARNGFSVHGIENSRLMYNVAKSKWDSLPKNLQEKVQFTRKDHLQALKEIRGKFDAAIFMGNALAHMPNTYLEALQELDRILSSKNALIVTQLINHEKAIKTNNRLFLFSIKQSKLSPEWEHAYFWFYDPPRKKGGPLILNAGILNFNGRIWTIGSMNSVPTVLLTKDKLNNIFRKIRFPRTSFYGTKKYGSLFSNSFKILESDWLNVIAKR